MSQHHRFLTSRVKPLRRVARQMHAIGRKHGAWLVEARLEDGYWRWFASEWRGPLGNWYVQRDVEAALRFAGILDNHHSLISELRAWR